MDPSRREQIKSLFERAVQLPAEEREAFLERACAGDSPLRRELDSLIMHAGDASAFFGDLAEDILPGVGATPHKADPFTGHRIAQYDVLERLGGGGMGVVYKARDYKLGRLVALKFLTHSLQANEDAKRRFIQEAKAASALDHQHIGTIYEINETDEGSLFIAMAYYEGETLKDVIARGPLPIGVAVDYVVQLAAGLAKAHQAGIVHRDIKPANAIVTKDGVVKIVDFGLAKMTGGDPLTKTGATMGTLAYMSPEQIQGQEVDHRTDLWSLGVMLYEMLAGKRPFSGDYESALLYNIVHGELEPIKVLRPDVPAKVATIAEHLLHKDKEQRCQEAVDVLKSLDAYNAPSSPGSAHRNTPFDASRSNSVWIGTGVVMVLIIMILGVWRVMSDGETASTTTPSNRTAIAVLPFSVNAGDNLAYLQDGMVTLLSTNLDGAGVLRAIDSNALLGSLGEDHGPVRDIEQARDIAVRFGARYFILGSVTKLGDQVQLNAFLYDQSGVLKKQAEEIAAGEQDLMGAIDGLTRQIVIDLLSDPRQEVLGIGARATTSLEALKAYLEGDWLIREGRFDEAVGVLEHAVEKDSTFAMGWFRLADAYGWDSSSDRNMVTFALRAAGRHGDRLPEKMQKLLLARMNAQKLPEAEKLYREVVADYPEDALAWFGLADVLNHNGWLFGRPLYESREPLERALAFDYHPSNREILFHLQEAAYIERDLALLDSVVTLWGPDYFSSSWAISYASAHGHTAQVDSIITHLEQETPSTIRWSGVLLIKWLEDIPTAQRVGRLLTAPRIPEDWQSRGHFYLSIWNVARGRLNKAEDEYAASGVMAGTALVQRVLDRALPFYPHRPEELEQLRYEVAQWDTTQAPIVALDPGLEFRPAGTYTIIQTYLTGLLSLLQDDRDAFQNSVERLRQWAETDTPDRSAYILERTLTAYAGWRDGETTETMAILDNAIFDTVPWQTEMSPIRTQALNRYIRAEVLFAEGRYEEALPWYETLPDGRLGVSFMGPSLLRRAEIHERLGRPDQAIDHYRRFIELWEGSDPELQPWVDDARQSLNRLLEEEVREPGVMVRSED